MKDLESTIPSNDNASLRVRVRADRLYLLYHQSFPAVYVSVIVALLLCVGLWGQVRDGVLIGWMVFILVSAVIRYGLFWVYRRRKPSGLQILDWELPYAITLFVPSLAWGLGVLWIMTQSTQLFQVVAFIYLLGMAGGATSLYSARRYMAVGAMVCVLLPAAIWLIFKGTVLEVGLGVAALFFMVVQIRASTTLSAALGGNFRLAHRLAAARRRSERLAQTDELTGLNNRRAFFDRGQTLANYCERGRLPLSMVMIDADHFKQINDNYGHAAGDAVLRHLADQLRLNLRKSDVCGRLGGEEFALLLPDTSLAEQFRKSYAAMPTRDGNLEITNTVSIGVASDGYDIGHLLHCADAGLYQAKATGRNRVVSQACTGAADGMR